MTIGRGVNDFMNSRKHLVEGLKNSLVRLQLEYFDIVYSHKPDYKCSLERPVLLSTILLRKV